MSQHSDGHSVSIIIPSYNGRHLLEENLPAVEKILSDQDELIIVDDGGTDDTLEFLSQRFGLGQPIKKRDKYGQFQVCLAQNNKKAASDFKVKLVINPLNLRFAASCNRGVKQAEKQLVLLLNNDVVPGKDLLKQLKPHFKDQKVFAVGCLETEPNQNNIQGGKNKLWFEKGLFQHSRADKFTPGETAWASGGSAIFNRKKWLQLDGFDEDFYPAYWEDIDLSYRARQKGWKVLFQPQAKVIHNHETTHQTVFTQEQLQNLSWKHAHRFVWKNGTFKQKLQNLVHKPHWCLQRLKTKIKQPAFIAFLAIVVLAAILRFIYLGQVPSGMTWDEAAIGYNGYAVVHTRRDEWLEFMPISFRSFDVYKAPLPVYLNGIFTTIFGLNLWAVRLPFAISGVLAVIGLIQLTQELAVLTNFKNKFSFKTLGLTAGLLLAVSPWHLHFTRVGFESGLSLSFLIWGLWYVLRYLKKMHVVSLKLQLKLLLPAVLLLAAALYSYHSAYITVPLLLILLLKIGWPKIKQNLFSPALGAAAAVLISLPLIYDSFFGGSLTRAGTMIFNQADRASGILSLLVERAAAHLSLQFLVLGWTDTLRHGPGAWGALLPVTYFLVCLGLAVLAFRFITRKKISCWPKLALIFLLIGLLPAVLGQEMPQANRGLTALPGFIWLALYGLDRLAQVLRKHLKPERILIILAAVHVITVGFYLNYYYTGFAAASAPDFQDGYIEAFEIAHQYETGAEGKPEVSQIIFSNHYGQAYIYALFVRKTNPIWYQGGSLIKYLFVDRVDPSMLSRSSTLLVASQADSLPEAEADHLVISSDGQVRFMIFYTGDGD